MFLCVKLKLNNNKLKMYIHRKNVRSKQIGTFCRY